MESSNLPETAEFHLQSQFLDAAMMFTDLDVVSDDTM